LPAIELMMVSAAVPDLEVTSRAWRSGTDYQVVSDDKVSPELAMLWGVSPRSHNRVIVTGAPGASRGLVRFVAGGVSDPRPHPIYDIRGPMAIEFFAHDASRVYERFKGDELFTPIAEPIDYDLSSIGSGRVQSVGLSNTWGLTVFVSTMKWVPPPRQLPVSEHFLGPAVNVPIVALDREASIAFYTDLLGIPIRFDGTVQDPDVNRIMGAPPDLRFHITVFFIGDGQMAEHHFHDPRRVVESGRPPNHLRTGTLGSTYRVTGLDSILARATASGYEPRGPIVSSLPPYDSARVACLTGPNGELVELVET
jgi:catechol 2,3-dioxygenase-like lactoylglutathione lyase family enzyme